MRFAVGFFGNATTGITRTSTSVTGFSQPSNNVKTTSTGGHDPWNTQRYLNIWVCDLLPVWDGLQWLSLLGYSPSPGPFITYPNPVDDILTVEIEQEAIDNAIALYQTRTGAPYAIEPVFEFRLYNELGSQVRYVTAKSGSVQFNVSNLPNGLYYLHIYDGISDKPEKQIIRVKH